MGFLELGYRGAIVFDSNEKNFIFLIKIEQAPESHAGFVKQKFRGPIPHLLFQCRSEVRSENAHF